jgi:hypothetical protein
LLPSAAAGDPRIWSSRRAWDFVADFFSFHFATGTCTTCCGLIRGGAPLLCLLLLLLSSDLPFCCIAVCCPRSRFQVWSLVRSFDQPQKYKPFVARCVVRGGQLEIGSLRDVNVKTGLPATTSTERLERLDDDEHLLSVKFVGGDHRLQVRTLRLLSLSAFCACSVFFWLWFTLRCNNLSQSGLEVLLL